MLDWDSSKVQYDWCPYKKREIRTQTHIHRRGDYEKMDAETKDETDKMRTTETASNQQKLGERHRSYLPSEPTKEPSLLRASLGCPASELG